MFQNIAKFGSEFQYNSLGKKELNITSKVENHRVINTSLELYTLDSKAYKNSCRRAPVVLYKVVYTSIIHDSVGNSSNVCINSRYSYSRIRKEACINIDDSQY